MDFIRSYIQFMQLGVEYSMNQVGIDTRDERGAVSTEMAVTISALVAIAVVAGAIFMAKAQSNANNIPDTVNPPAG